MNYILFIIPVIGALIGWIINSIAIKMLFRPYQPKKLLGFTFQGAFPKRQQQLAETLGKLASAEFVSFDAIEQKISDPKNLEKVMPLIEKHVDDFLRVKLGKEMPVISMFIGNKTIDSLKKVFIQEIEALFPQVMNQFAGNIKAEFDVEKMVAGKIASIAPVKLEKTLLQALSKEFRYIKILGAVTGLIIGIIQLLVIVLIA